MIKIKTIKLGSKCKDIATGSKGTLTHWICNMGRNITYIFQPEGCNPDTGQPVRSISLEIERLEYNKKDLENVEVPIEILGSIVRDKASGFQGMATEFMRHINGCFHVIIQPKGRLKKTNCAIDRNDFDLRSCEGDKIPKMTEEETEKSKKTRPSPSGGFRNTTYMP